MTANTLVSSCACGKVRFEAVGEPILAGVCYCDDCQAGARKIEALEDAGAVLDADGGSSTIVYRDDRIKCVSGKDLLVPVKLREKSPTSRFVASCCNSGMYIKYKRGHWVSAYRNRFAGDLPEIDLRTQTQFRDSDLPFPDDAPRHRKFPMSLFGKLIRARVDMWIGR